MNDETKEILIDLIDYWNTMGTESDPGMEAFCSVVQRASKTLERHAEEQKIQATKRSSDIDPFAMDVVGNQEQFTLKLESDW